MALATRPKPSVHHKKRQAKHHRHSKPYLKTYWPYLPMLLVVVIGLCINIGWTGRAVLGSDSDYSSATLLDATNSNRSMAGEAPLSIDPQLTAAAQAKANDMVSKNYWAHNAPDGKTPWSFINGAGYQYQIAGENLAYGFDNARDAVTGWMNSPEHRANILRNEYQNVGFGVATSPNYQGKGPETVIVAEYGEPTAAAANISFTVPPPTGTAGAQDNQLTDVAARPVSRIQLLTGGRATWATVVASALAGGALAIFLVRHGLRLRRWAVEGEVFIAHHPLLDITVVVVFTAGFVLTRTTGLIR